MSDFVKGQQVTVRDPATRQHVTATVRFPYGVSIGLTMPDGSTHWYYPYAISTSSKEPQGSPR